MFMKWNRTFFAAVLSTRRDQPAIYPSLKEIDNQNDDIGSLDHHEDGIESSLYPSLFSTSEIEQDLLFNQIVIQTQSKKPEIKSIPQISFKSHSRSNIVGHDDEFYLNFYSFKSSILHFDACLF
jgi:hypothetical protein